jgi:hypothetical protein
VGQHDDREWVGARRELLAPAAIVQQLHRREAILDRAAPEFARPPIRPPAGRLVGQDGQPGDRAVEAL